MNSDVILARLRRFLLALAGLLLAGTLVELVALRHWGEPLQLTPFVLSVAGLAAVTWAGWRAGRRSLLVLRGLMVLLAVASLVGVYVHVRGNIGMFSETHAGASMLATLAAGIGGRNPLLAPGMLALAGILAAAATYCHPALNPALSRSAGPGDVPGHSHEKIGETNA